MKGTPLIANYLSTGEYKVILNNDLLIITESITEKGLQYLLFSMES